MADEPIIVDYRVGSKHLLKPLQEQGLTVIEDTLKFGDVAFVGRGKGDEPVTVGIELKKLPDLCQSLKNRLPADQLPGLVTHYDRAWLLVEGEWRQDAQGRVTVEKWDAGAGRMLWKPLPGAPMASELDKRLLTLETVGGLHVRETNTTADTVRWLTSLFRFWTDKALDEHRSHLAVHAPDIDQRLFNKPSQFVVTLRTLPGLEAGRLRTVEQFFGGDILRAMQAPVEVWAGIEIADAKGKVRRLGPATAAKIVAAIRGTK